MHQYDDAAVRHLLELGYVDPDDVAAREASLLQSFRARLREAASVYGQGHADEAVTLLEGLARDSPDWFPPRQLLVEIHYHAGRCAEAQRQLDWLTDHGVERPRLSQIAGGIAFARRELDSALDALHYASHVAPNLQGVNTLLGSALLRLGRLTEAEEALRKAVQQNPSDARAYDGLAAVFLRRGEYEDAAERALQALEHDMQLFDAHYHLGAALARLDRPQQAIAALEASARLDPSRIAPFRWLSWIAERQLGDSVRSAMYRERARRIIQKRRGLSA